MFTIDKTVVTEKRFSMQRLTEWSPVTQSYDPTTSLYIRLLRGLPVEKVIEFNFPMGRLDLFSYTVYGDTQFWEALFFYNDYRRFFDYKPGVTVKYPSLKNIEQLVSTFDTKGNKFI
jgi:hypothetical protein